MRRGWVGRLGGHPKEKGAVESTDLKRRRRRWSGPSLLRDLLGGRSSSLAQHPLVRLLVSDFTVRRKGPPQRGHKILDWNHPKSQVAVLMSRPRAGCRGSEWTLGKQIANQKFVLGNSSKEVH